MRHSFWFHLWIFTAPRKQQVLTRSPLMVRGEMPDWRCWGRKLSKTHTTVARTQVDSHRAVASKAHPVVFKFVIKGAASRRPNIQTSRFSLLKFNPGCLLGRILLLCGPNHDGDSLREGAEGAREGGAESSKISCRKPFVAPTRSERGFNVGSGGLSAGAATNRLSSDGRTR